MQKRHVKLLILAVFVTILVILPQQVNAFTLYSTPYTFENVDETWDKSLEIVIKKATYLDYDHDRNKDDVLTVFNIVTPFDGWENGKIDVTCALTKPSGETIVFNVEIKTRTGIELTIVWFNFADEPGWYTLFVQAIPNIGNIGQAYLEHAFDPPGGEDKGLPEIEIMSIIQL